MPEQGTKMYVDAILKTHERVVQVKLLASPRRQNALLDSREVFAALLTEQPNDSFCLSVCLAAQSEHLTVSSLYGRSFKESTRRC